MIACLKDNNGNLDNKVELEDFLDETVHKIQFQRLTRKDQKSKLLEAPVQFSQHWIARTLNQLHEENIKPSFSANP